MRILQVHNRYRHRGGEDAVVERERADLLEAGHDVIPYVVSNAGSGLETLVRLTNAPWNSTESRRIGDVIQSVRPDVVHVHNTWYRLSSSVIAEASELGVATVHTLHNYRAICIEEHLLRDGEPCDSCLSVGPTQAVRHRCFRDSVPLSIVAAATRSMAQRRGVWTSHVDRFIAMTKSTADLFAQWGFPSDRISVRPHRIPDPGPRMGPPRLSTDVLFVGRLEESKGIIQLCEAWSLQPRPFRLVVLGDGPLAARLADSCPAADLAGRISASDAIAEMLGARALIFPSLWPETFGNVVAEAMACGLPAAVSSLAPIREYVGQAGMDWTFDPQSPTDWDRIFTLIAKDETVDIAGAQARLVYEAHFASDSAASLVAIYQEAIHHRRESDHRRSTK